MVHGHVIPSDVGESRGVPESLDGSGNKSEALGVILVRGLKQHLQADTYAEQGSIPLCNRRPEPGLIDPVHDATRGSDARKHQSVGFGDVRWLASDDDVRPNPRQALGDRHQVAGPVIDDGDRRHVVPLVEAIPTRRSSTATAIRNARATDLIPASATW